MGGDPNYLLSGVILQAPLKTNGSEPKDDPFEKGMSSSKSPFLGSMLVFQKVSKFRWPSPSKQWVLLANIPVNIRVQALRIIQLTSYISYIPHLILMLHLFQIKKKHSLIHFIDPIRLPAATPMLHIQSRHPAATRRDRQGTLLDEQGTSQAFRQTGKIWKTPDWPPGKVTWLAAKLDETTWRCIRIPYWRWGFSSQPC